QEPTRGAVTGMQPPGDHADDGPSDAETVAAMVASETECTEARARRGALGTWRGTEAMRMFDLDPHPGAVRMGSTYPLRGQLFEAGAIAASPGALNLCTDEHLKACLARHVRGDWGDVSYLD